MLLCFWINAVLYASLAVWCTALPTKTSQFLGYTLSTPSSRSEYLVVYGGLEAGLAVFFGLAAVRPDLAVAGVWFGRCLYTGLAVWRLGTIIGLRGLGPGVWALFAIEAGMTLWFWMLPVS